MIISTKVWDRAEIELATPGSTVRLASVARQVTDCAMRPSLCFFACWVILHTFLSSADFKEKYKKKTQKKQQLEYHQCQAVGSSSGLEFSLAFQNLFQEYTIRVPNSLDPNQARHFVWPDLGPN